MKKAFPLTISLCSLILCGCLKSLDSESVADGTLFKGVVMESGSGMAASGVNVVITNGERNGDESSTASDGSFALTVSFQQLHEGYYMLLSADSLYRATTIPLPNIGYGLKEYDLQSIYVDGPELPTVQTDNVSGITQSSAVGGGSINDDGRSAIRRRGVCWSTATNPTIVNNHAEAGIGSGHFTVAISDLQPGQIYHVRAYAENGVGIAYGQDVVFSTQTGVPLVTTAAVSEITQNSVTCGGIVTSDNGNTVTARGICYSSSATTPTINDAHTLDDSGTGSFTSQITDLQSGTTYYLRAYATNALGTGYGEVKTVTTF